MACSHSHLGIDQRMVADVETMAAPPKCAKDSSLRPGTAGPTPRSAKPGRRSAMPPSAPPRKKRSSNGKVFCETSEPPSGAARPPETEKLRMPPPPIPHVVAHVPCARANATSPINPDNSAEACKSAPLPSAVRGRASLKKVYSAEVFVVRRTAPSVRMTSSEALAWQGKSSRCAAFKRKVCRPMPSETAKANLWPSWRGPAAPRSSAPLQPSSSAGSKPARRTGERRTAADKESRPRPSAPPRPNPDREAGIWPSAPMPTRVQSRSGSRPPSRATRHPGSGRKATLTISSPGAGETSTATASPRDAAAAATSWAAPLTRSSSAPKESAERNESIAASAVARVAPCRPSTLTWTSLTGVPAKT
mmetsp:Transcript_31468/g.86550  ORF Transcript_31468/g.86550 Transcript_31468/m.86550 type:complete len:363 (-) Transcript_31468:140-1228(-)